MIEKIYNFSTIDELKIERVIFDENVHYIHMVFPQNEGLAEHNANSNLYISVLRGHLSLVLDAQEEHIYPRGTLVIVPNKTRMKITNFHEEVLELIVVKAPVPSK